MLFSKPYHLDDDALCAGAPNTSRSEEIPLEYHLNKHTQHCSCGATNNWSELTLISFHRARKCKIVRAAPKVEYRLPVAIHYHDDEHVDICFFCGPFKTFGDLPLPPAPIASRPIPLGWRKIAQPTEQKKKVVVTDDDLLA